MSDTTTAEAVTDLEAAILRALRTNDAGDTLQGLSAPGLGSILRTAGALEGPMRLLNEALEALRHRELIRRYRAKRADGTRDVRRYRLTLAGFDLIKAADAAAPATDGGRS